MKKHVIVSIITFFLSLDVCSEEISVSLKPTKRLTGTSSVTFDEDGKVTLLVYETPTKITDRLLPIDSKAVAELRGLATEALKEYLVLKQYSQLRSYKVLVAIAITQDSVPKSISSRKLTKRALLLIEKLRPYLPDKYRVNIDANLITP